MEDTSSLGRLTFLFYSGTSPIDRVIRWRTRSPFSHVAVLVGTDVLYEATDAGWVRRTGQEASDHAQAAKLAIPTTPEVDDLERAVAWAEARLGTVYGYESDLALAFSLVLSRPGVFVCSTGAAEIGVRAGVLDDVDERAETPGSLAEVLQAQGSRTGP